MQKNTFDESRLGLRDDLSLSLSTKLFRHKHTTTTTTTTVQYDDDDDSSESSPLTEEEEEERKSVAFSFLWSFFVFFLFCVVACVVRIQFVFGETD